MSYDKTIQRKDIPDLLVLALAQLWHMNHEIGAYQALIERGFPRKVVEAKIYQLVYRDWLEYGVSIGYVWPTEEGREVLRQSNLNELSAPAKPRPTA